MSDPKRHHYVPQFYLRYFLPTPDSLTFWVYDKEGGLPRAQTPQNTAVERHFYSVELPGGGRDDRLERNLAQLEGISKPILDRWQEPRARPEPIEAQEIASFLGFMHARVPREVELVKEIDKTILIEKFREWAKNPQTLEEMLERYKTTVHDAKAPTAEDMRSYLERPEDHFEFEIDQKFALGQALMSAEMTRKELLRMNWCLCETPAREFFLTSDSPLCVFLYDDGYASFGGGMALPNVEVTFPVSPQICLLLDRQRTQRRRRVSRAVVRELNRRTAWNAQRFVISSFRTNRVTQLIEWSAKTRAMPKVDRLALAELYRARSAMKGG